MAEAENAPETPPVASKKSRNMGTATVVLRTERDTYFDLSAHSLATVTPEGTEYTTEQADEVLTLAQKHGVHVYEAEEV